MSLPKGQNIVSWILQLVAAVVLFQTLFFKFTGAKESVYIFTTLGIEPWGRIGSGVAELIASILLLAPPTVFVGAALSLGVITVAIVGHLTNSSLWRSSSSCVQRRCWSCTGRSYGPSGRCSRYPGSAADCCNISFNRRACGRPTARNAGLPGWSCSLT